MAGFVVVPASDAQVEEWKAPIRGGRAARAAIDSLIVRVELLRDGAVGVRDVADAPTPSLDYDPGAHDVPEVISQLRLLVSLGAWDELEAIAVREKDGRARKGVLAEAESLWVAGRGVDGVNA